MSSLTADSVTCIDVDTGATDYYCIFATCCEKCKMPITSRQKMSLKAAEFRPGRLSTWTPQTTTSGPSINLWSGRHFEQLRVRLREGGFIVGDAFSTFRIFRGNLNANGSKNAWRSVVVLRHVKHSGHCQYLSGVLESGGNCRSFIIPRRLIR